MKTIRTSRALALGVTAALAATALPFTVASAAPLPRPDALVASSNDGLFFQLSDYGTGDIVVQAIAAGQTTDVDDSQDLSFTWTVTPFGAGTSSVVAPAATQTIDSNGAFVVALPTGKGPGTYVLNAELGADGLGIGDIGPADVLSVNVGNASADDDSSAAISGLNSSTPGLAETGTLKVTAPDNTYGTDSDTLPDPVANQVYTLTVDHGFFTEGEPSTSVIGAKAGNLPSSGTRFTGITNGDGEFDFNVGIGRDAGFDLNGRVAATVKVVNGPAASAVVEWSTDNPLNGGQVAIRVSPDSAQLNPVNPTLAGNSTVYDVFALDQFSNPVGGVAIDLTSEGPRKNVENDPGEALSDFDSAGDFSVVSYVAQPVTTTGTWRAAPSYVFTSPSGLPDRVDDEDLLDDVVGSIATTTYEINFNASRFSMSSSVSDTVRVGTTVTQTVRAVDQLGNPIEGFDVRFLRYGPGDGTNGDVVAAKTTNVLGEATYSFIGNRRGRSSITAEITDGKHRQELNGSAAFGAVVNARLTRTKGASSAGRLDRLTVSATKLASGARVQVYRIVKGKQKLVGTKKLSRKGVAAFEIRDRNRNRKTKYVAVIRSTSTSIADQSRTVTVR